MIKFSILTLFPEMFLSTFEYGIIKRAKEKCLIEIKLINIRDFTRDKHKTVDDKPFGGGEGMVMKPEPIARALDSLKDNSKKTQIILLSPQGELFNHETAKELSNLNKIILICGRYEGVDERIVEIYINREISIGDYVLMGGELPAMVLVETIARLIPGVVGKRASVEKDSYYYGLLKYPQYTRPSVFRGYKVPEPLLLGNHKEIENLRKRESLKRTLLRRPELLKTAELSDEDLKILEEVKKEIKK